MIVILFFILILTISIFMLNYLYKQTNYYKNQMIDTIDIKQSIKRRRRYEIAVIGSSQARYAIDLSQYNGINFASRPQTLSIDREVLVNHVDKIQTGGILVISLCIMDFFLLKFKNSTDYLRYSTLIPHNKFSQIGARWNYSTWVQAQMPLIYNPLNIRYVIKDVKAKDTLSIDHNLCDSESKLKIDADYWISLWEKEFTIKIPNIEIPDRLLKNIESNILNLKQLLATCRRNEIKPVIIIPPVTGILLSKFSNNFLNKYLYENIKNSISEEVPVLNYLDNKDFYEVDLYMDSFFLNKKGRLKFTKRVLNDINNLRL